MITRSYLTKNLREGETLVAIARRHLASLFLGVVFSIMFLLAPFFFLFPLVRLGQWGILGFFVLVTIGILLTTRTTMLYFLNMLAISTKRIIEVDQLGFFEQRVNEVNLEKIQNVSFSVKGVFQTLFRYGAVHIRVVGQQQELTVKNVARPEQVHQTLLHVLATIPIQQAKQAEQSDDTPMQKLRDLQNTMGREEFSRVVKRITKE